MCHNPETWHISEKYKRDPEKVLEIIDEKLSRLLTHFKKVSLTLLGGEPLAPHNRGEALKISKYFKKKYGEQITVVLFSWRTPKDIVKENLLKYVQYVDEFVLGRYLHKYHQNSFPASKNQLYLNRADFEKAVSVVKGRELNGSSVLIRK